MKRSAHSLRLIFAADQVQSTDKHFFAEPIYEAPL